MPLTIISFYLSNGILTILLRYARNEPTTVL